MNKNGGEQHTSKVPPKDPTIETYGALFRHYRHLKGLSQSQVALRVGTGRNHVLEWEKNIKKPNMVNFISLVRVLKIPWGAIIGVEKGEGEL